MKKPLKPFLLPTLTSLAVSLAVPSVSLAEIKPVVIPNKITTSEVCYRNAKNKPVCQKFSIPDVDFGTGRSAYVDASPLDPSRSVFELPTYPLAEYHWWIFNTTREIAQQQYGGCVERYSAYQELLGIYPQINDPEHPVFVFVSGIRDYRVPFNPLTPKTLEFARANADAAIFSTNLAVYHLGLCESQADILKNEVFKKLQSKAK